MEYVYEIVSFPINSEHFISSPICDVIHHFTKDADECIKILFQKNNVGISCIIGIDESYDSTVLSVFRSHNFVIKRLLNFEWPKSHTILHRRIVKEYNSQQKTDILSISEIQNNNSSPTMNYLLNTLEDGSGILVLFGQLEKRKQNIKIENLNKELSQSGYLTSDLTVIDRLQSDTTHSIVLCFFIGDDHTQETLAKEMTFVLPEMDYAQARNIDFNSFDIQVFLNNLVTKSIDNNRMMSPLLYLMSDEELPYIYGAFDLISSNPYISKNLDSIWETNVNFCFRTVPGGLSIGKSFSDDTEFFLPRYKLRQGLLVVGSPGSGKGNQLFSLISQLKDVPLLIFESAKQEMHHLRYNPDKSKAIDDLQTWRPVAGEYLFNPFEIPPELTLSEYRSSLIQMLRVCFRLDGPLEELFTSTLNRCFYNANYNDSSCSTDSNVSRWGLHEFIVEYSKMIQKSGYSPKTKDDMRQAGLTRLKALIDENPDVYDTNYSVPITRLIKGHNLIQLNNLPTVDAKQSFATMLLIALGAYLQLRMQHCADKNQLNLVIVMDESHNLLKTVNNINGEGYSFSDDFANLMLTLRSVGVGFIISDQTTTNIPKVIADICDTKIFMGSSKFSGIADYLDFLGADEGLLQNLYQLSSGQGVMSTSNAQHGVVFSTDNIIDTYNLSDDCETTNDFKKSTSLTKTATFSECVFCPYYSTKTCCLSLKQSSRSKAQKINIMCGNPVPDDVKDIIMIKKKITDYIRNHFIDNKSFCSIIQFLRLCKLEYGIILQENDIKQIIDVLKKYDVQ